MKIITGILLLTIVVFLHFKCTESRIPGSGGIVRRGPRPIIIPNETSVFIEMADGSVYGGFTQQQQIYRFPTWIQGGHNGLIRIFIQSLNNIGYIVTQIRALQRHHTNIGRMSVFIQLERNNILHVNLNLRGDDQPPPNARARVYAALPDGRTVNGYLV